MQLEILVNQVSVIEKVIADLNYSMRHVSPQSVDAIRSQKEELELILVELLDSCVESNFDLESMLGKNGDCLRECIRPVYSGKPVVLPKPKWDVQPPPPPPDPPVASVPGVNLIIYIDTSGSMRGTLSASGAVHKAVIALASYLKTQSNRANIPCTVSLVWFGDGTDVGGDGANFYTVAMRKADVSGLEAKLNAPTWYLGGMTLPESGLLCIQKTLASLVDSSVANTLLYITDAHSKPSESGATPTTVKKLISDNKVSAYAIVPTKGTPDISSLFKGVKEYTKPPHDLTAWGAKTLNP